MSKNEVVTVDGEIVDESFNLPTVGAEISQQIATARRFPRDLRVVQQSIMQLATLSESGAAEMTYLLKRTDTKTNKEVRIEGPSIRFAEMVAQCFGNCRVAARVVEVSHKDGRITAEGAFLDLEKNVATSKSVQRNIRGRSGKIYGQDLIQQTGNAACSIAQRNAILAGVPRILWGEAWEASKELLRGKEGSRLDSIKKMLDAFQTGFGVSEDRVLAYIGVERADQITLQQLGDIRATYATIKNQEATVDQIFNPGDPDHEVVENPLDDGEVKKAASKSNTKKSSKKTEDEPPHDPGADEVDEDGEML